VSTHGFREKVTTGFGHGFRDRKFGFSSMSLGREIWVFGQDLERERERERERDLTFSQPVERERELERCIIGFGDFCSESESLEYFVERAWKIIKNMSWVKFLTEVNMILSSNVVFGYQESSRKIENVMQIVFSQSLKQKKKKLIIIIIVFFIFSI